MNRRTIAAVGLVCLAVPFYQAQEKPSEHWTAKRNRYRHAATHGRPEAQYRLGILYREAKPGPQNRSRFRILAHAWLSHAVRTVQRSGHLRVAYASRLPTYISARDTLEANMQSLEVDEARGLFELLRRVIKYNSPVAEWRTLEELQQHALQGEPGAAIGVAQAYAYSHLGASRDLVKAYAWAKVAILLGSTSTHARELLQRFAQRMPPSDIRAARELAERIQASRNSKPR